MWIDHCTLALDSLFALDHVWTLLGAEVLSAPPLFGGTTRRVVSLHDNFLELVSVSDPREARRAPWGGPLLRFLKGGEGIFRVVVGLWDLDQFIARRLSLGTRYWPPISEVVTRGGQESVPARMTQIDFMTPWLIEYSQARPVAFSGSEVRLNCISVQSQNPDTTALHYRLSLGLPILSSPRGQEMTLTNGRFQFIQGQETGYTGIVLKSPRAEVLLRPLSGRLIASV